MTGPEQQHGSGGANAAPPAPAGGKIASILRSERKFLYRPLNLTSRLLLVAAAAAIVGSFFFPLWKMHLFAPQYQEGLTLLIYSHRIQGGGVEGADLAEINTLNHYIGMHPLQQADFFEMQWMPFVFGLIILLLLRAAVFGEMSNAVDVFALFTYFGVFSIGAFYYRLYVYGHNLNPAAPMKIEPFTPLLIGTKRIANFTQHSYPQGGAYLLIVAVLLVALSAWCSRKEVA